MGIRLLTDATGKRMATAMEGIAGVDNTPEVKIPHIDFFDFVTLDNFASNYGHVSTQEITVQTLGSTSAAGSPLLNFLAGLSTLSNFDTADEGRVAYISYSFMKMLLFEASRFNHNAIVKTKDGIVTKIDNCCIKPVDNENLPFDFSFLILGSGMVNGLNELEAQGKLDDAEALNALLNAYSDQLYVHSGTFELETLPVTVTPGSAGKVIVKIDREKNIDTDKWFYKTAEDMASLPAVTYGTSVDVTSSSAPWYAATELVTSGQNYLGDNTWEITPTAGHEAIKIVELKRTMKPYAYRAKHIAVGA